MIFEQVLEIMVAIIGCHPSECKRDLGVGFHRQIAMVNASMTKCLEMQLDPARIERTSC